MLKTNVHVNKTKLVEQAPTKLARFLVGSDRRPEERYLPPVPASYSEVARERFTRCAAMNAAFTAKVAAWPMMRVSGVGRRSPLD